MEGLGAVSLNIVKQRFQRLIQGNTSLNDEERSGRPSVVDAEAVRQKVESYPQTSTRRLSGELECSQSTV